MCRVVNGKFAAKDLKKGFGHNREPVLGGTILPWKVLCSCRRKQSDHWWRWNRSRYFFFGKENDGARSPTHIRHKNRQRRHRQERRRDRQPERAEADEHGEQAEPGNP